MKQRSDFTTAEDYKEYLRHYYAGLALQGLMTHFNNVSAKEWYAARAIEVSDELINQLQIK